MEAKFTRCPHCKTVFRLLPNQLAAAQGRVRCGACLQVFPADQHLVRPVQKVTAPEPAKSVLPATEVNVIAPSVDEVSLPETPAQIELPQAIISAAPVTNHELAVSATQQDSEPLDKGDIDADPWANFGQAATDVVEEDVAAEQPESFEDKLTTAQPLAEPAIDVSENEQVALSQEAEAIDNPQAAELIDELVEVEPLPVYQPAPSQPAPVSVKPPLAPTTDDDEDLRFDDDNGLQQDDVDEEPVIKPATSRPVAPTSPDLDDDFIHFEVRDDVPADTTGLPSDWFSGSPVEQELAAFKPVPQPGGDFGEGNQELRQTPVQNAPASASPSTPAKPAMHGHWQGEHVYGLQEEPLPLPHEHDSWQLEPPSHTPEPQFYDLPSTAPKWPWKGLALLAVALLLIGLLVSQILWPKRAEWREDEQWGHYVESICQHIDCELPPRRNVKKISLVQKASVVKDARDPKKLKIDLLMQNAASFEQAFPDIELTFTDIDGQTVATRRFQPSEYLGKDEPPTIMPMQVPVHISFVVVEPKPTVTGFEFAFLPSSEPPPP